MPSFELICLSNSKKLGARCIAGLRTDTGEWIRPISSAKHGELDYSQRNLGDDGDPQNFDVIQIGFARHVPTDIQPENWLVDGTAWKLIHRPAPSHLQALLQNALICDKLLFGSHSDRIAAYTLSAAPVKKSLALVKPRELQWLTDSYGNKKKARVQFCLNANSYNLAITDPPFEEKLKALHLGTTSRLN
jgi:putative nucleic acid modification protein with dual OB domain